MTSSKDSRINKKDFLPLKTRLIIEKKMPSRKRSGAIEMINFAFSLRPDKIAKLSVGWKKSGAKSTISPLPSEVMTKNFLLHHVSQTVSPLPKCHTERRRKTVRQANGKLSQKATTHKIKSK